MRASTSFLAALASVVTLGSCDDSSFVKPEIDLTVIPGCYQVRVSSWINVRRVSSFPAQVELVDARTSEQPWQGEFVAKPLSSANQSLKLVSAAWNQPKSDSLVIGGATLQRIACPD